MSLSQRFNPGRATPDFKSASQPEPEPNKQRKRYPRITLRISEAEEAELKRRAQGMSMSAYVRSCVFGEEASRRRKRRSYVPVADQQLMAQALALLGQSHIANNLNQLAYHANTGTLPVDEDIAGKINEAYDHVLAMRAALFEALGRQANV